MEAASTAAGTSVCMENGVWGLVEQFRGFLYPIQLMSLLYALWNQVKGKRLWIWFKIDCLLSLEENEDVQSVCLVVCLPICLGGYLKQF